MKHTLFAMALMAPAEKRYNSYVYIVPVEGGESGGHAAEIPWTI